MRFQVSLSSWLALYATGVVEAGLETRPRAITRRQSSPESDKFMRRVNAAGATMQFTFWRKPLTDQA